MGEELKTMQDVLPEPLGHLQLFSATTQEPLLVWECPRCVTLTTDIAGHTDKVHSG